MWMGAGFSAAQQSKVQQAASCFAVCIGLPAETHNRAQQSHFSMSKVQQSSRRRLSESAPPTSSSLEGPTTTSEARSRGQGAGCSGLSPDRRLHSQVSVSCS